MALQLSAANLEKFEREFFQSQQEALFLVDLTIKSIDFPRAYYRTWPLARDWIKFRLEDL